MRDWVPILILVKYLIFTKLPSSANLWHEYESLILWRHYLAAKNPWSFISHLDPGTNLMKAPCRDKTKNLHILVLLPMRCHVVMLKLNSNFHAFMSSFWLFSFLKDKNFFYHFKFLQIIFLTKIKCNKGMMYFCYTS